MTWEGAELLWLVLKTEKARGQGVQVPLEAGKGEGGASRSLRRNQPCQHRDVSPHPGRPASHWVLQTCQGVSMWVCYRIDDRKPTPALAGSLPGASRLSSLQERQLQPAALTRRPLPPGPWACPEACLGLPREGTARAEPVERPCRGRAHGPFKQEEARVNVNLKRRALVRDVGPECGAPWV